jgi:hypothetical protein
VNELNLSAARLDRASASRAIALSPAGTQNLKVDWLNTGAATVQKLFFKAGLRVLGVFGGVFLIVAALRWVLP